MHDARRRARGRVAADESLERRVDALEAEVERLREAVRSLEARLG